MKKIFIALLFCIPMLALAQFGNQKYIPGVLCDTVTFTSSQTWVFNPAGKIYQWSASVNWGNCDITGKAYIKAQFSNDGTNWSDIKGEIGHPCDSILIDSSQVFIWGNTLPAAYMRYYLKVPAGFVIRKMSVNYVFKQ